MDNNDVLNMFLEAILLKVRSLSAEEYHALLMQEITYKKNVKIENTNQIFKNRISYRGDLTQPQIGNVLTIMNQIRNSYDYRPNALAGNINCYLMVIYDNQKNHTYIIDIDSSIPVNDIYKQDFLLNEKFLNEINRPDIKGNGGMYIFFLINPNPLIKKYSQLSLPLLFSTLGIIQENIILILTMNNYLSCLHYGVKGVVEYSYNNERYFLTSFIRFGRN